MHTSLVRSLIVFASCLSLMAGCVGDSSKQTYDTNSVIRAFRSVGVELRHERLSLDGCKDFPPGVTAMNMGCASDVIGLDGKPLSKKERGDFPQVALYRRERVGQRVWVIWIYPNPAVAERVLKAWDGRTWLGRHVEWAREGNVVAMFSRPEDGQQIEDAFAKL
jgi:hypothetical protein